MARNLSRFRSLWLVSLGGVALSVGLFVATSQWWASQIVELERARSAWLPWAVLFNGLLLTSFIVLYFYQLVRHTIKVEDLAARLEKTNEALKVEMSERQKAEAAQRHSQKMEAIGQLAAGIAHDFNNALTVINGYSDLQLQTMPKDHPLRADLEEILAAGERAAALVSELMTYARHQVMRPVTMNMNTLLLEMGKMLSKLVPAIINLSVLPDETLCWVQADPAYMEQVVTNLLLNACDAMPQGGRLTIRTQNISLPSGEWAMMEVSDTGAGMTDETKAHLFEPFFTTKDRAQRSGLGLATTYGIVSQSGGRLEVDSEPGKGSRFRVYLPKAVGEAIPPEVEAEPGVIQGGSETILVVEDEEMVRSFMSRVLTDRGYDVILATNGDEALHLAQKRGNHPLHLLFTDLSMPVMGGRELAARLRVARPGIKVLFTSGYPEQVKSGQGDVCDGTYFLRKPFSQGELLQGIRRAISA